MSWTAKATGHSCPTAALPLGPDGNVVAFGCAILKASSPTSTITVYTWSCSVAVQLLWEFTDMPVFTHVADKGHLRRCSLKQQDMGSSQMTVHREVVTQVISRSAHELELVVFYFLRLRQKGKLFYH